MNDLVIGGMPQERKTLNLGDYAEEAVLSEDQGKMTVRFWEHPTMTRGGYIVYPRPEECTIKRHIRKMQTKIFENIEKEENEKGR